MKFHTNIALPYPVIADERDDFLDSSYVVLSKVNISNTKVSIILDHNISLYEIEKAVEYSGELSYVTVIRCRSTFFRKAYFSDKPHQEINIKSLELRDEVFIEPYVVAKESITVKSNKINPEYGFNEIKYESGDVVAIALVRNFSHLKDAFKPLETVFEITLVKDLEDGDWELDTESDKLSIRVSKSVHEFESSYKNNKKGEAILLNSLYFAAVTEAVQTLKEGESVNTKWAKVFKARITNLSIDLDNVPSYKIANKLLKRPILKLNEIDNLSEASYEY
jgi:hypothetical protein